MCDRILLWRMIVNGRALLLAGYFGLTVIAAHVGGVPSYPSTAASSLLDIEVNVSEDGSRIGISVFNARATNIRVNHSYRQAEALGDLEVRFFGSGKVFESTAVRYESPEEFQVDWMPAGNGIGWSLPKSFFVARYLLTRGCYTLEVKFSNRASIHAPIHGDPGPASGVAVAKRRVCI